jgi:hypothetical protein
MYSSLNFNSYVLKPFNLNFTASQALEHIIKQNIQINISGLQIYETQITYTYI